MITTNVNGNPISQGFIDEIRSDSPNTIARLWYNDAEVPCDIVDITIEKGSCGSDPFMIGEVIGDLLQATVKDLNANLKGQVIECHIGALVNGDYEFISLGRFKVSEVKKTRYQSEITAYSGIVADSGNDFNKSGLNEPTIAELAIRLQSDLNCTISFDNGIDTTLPITAQLTEITDYQALQILAICCGGYAINTIDGNIVVKKYDATPTLEVDTGMMVNLPEIAEAEYRVRQIGVLVSDATVDNEGNEVEAVYYALDTQGYIKVVKQGTEYYLIDSQGNRIIADIRPETADIYFECAYMTEAMFEANIEPVVGYAYYPADIDLTLGDPRLEGSDVLQVEEVDGSLYPVPCHKVIHKYNGGFTTEVKSAEASDESNSIGTEYPITQRLQNLDRKTGTAQATADNAFSIADNTNQYFWFTGTGTDTGAHITEIPQEQWNDSSSPYYHSGGNLLARSNGIAVRNGLTELATFGANGAQVGVSAGGHTTIQSSGMKVYGSNGTVELANIGYGSGETTSGELADAPYFTFGTRASGSTVGNNSFAEGYRVTASGANSHAEGADTVASKQSAHAEGLQTTADASVAHAEGQQTTAHGYASHAEGYYTFANGRYSHAGGNGTVANGENQTAIGKYNVSDTSSLFIIGNGTVSARSNAFQVSSDAVTIPNNSFLRLNSGAGSAYNWTELYASTVNGTNNLYLQADGYIACYVGDASNDPTGRVYMYYDHMTITGAYLSVTSYVTASGYYNTNGQWYYTKNTSGTNRAMVGLNSSNDYFFGYGSYANNEGSSYFDGNNVYIRSNNSVSINKSTSITGSLTVSTFLKADGLTTTTNSANTWYGSGSTSLTVGRFYYNASSSKRFKHDIADLSNEELRPSRLYDVKVRQFKYNEGYLDEDDLRNGADVCGFIAEELYEAYPVAVDLDGDMKPITWNDRYIIPPMLSLIQEQHKEIEELKTEVQKLKWRMV